MQFQSCGTGKVPHATREEATREAIRMNSVRARSADDKEVWMPFSCAECEQWHIGRSGRPPIAMRIHQAMR